MSNSQIIHFSQLNQKLNLEERSKKDLIEFLNVSKGKILTLIKTVFSFINDKSLLKNEPKYSFNKYTIESKLVQTMSKIYNFYISNFPENGKETLHELIKERYLKFIKFYEQNINYFLNSNELQFRFYLIQGMILLWLIEIQYDTIYYDEIIQVINGIIRLNQDENGIINSNSKNEKNNYLVEFLNTILKFPYIKQNKEIIIHALEVNECGETLIHIFNENLNNLIKSNKSKARPEIQNIPENNDFELGKKSVSSEKEESYFSLMKENKKEKEKVSTSISLKRKSFSNASSHKSVLTSINSSGFYTPEFKHTKRDSLRHFRRFTINNINNPKTSLPKNKSTFQRSISSGMNNLLTKCEEGINNKKNNNINILNNINNKNGPSTKSKLRLAVEGHFYTEDDFKNNIDINKDIQNNSKNENFVDNNELTSEDKTNLIENEDEICPCDGEEEIENNIVSVDELPINPNLSMISNSNSKNIGVEPENIIQETKEEEENDDNDINNEKNNNNNKIRILTDNEIKDFFSQQFSDNKNKKDDLINKEKNKNNKNNDNINTIKINSNLFNNNIEENNNKKKANKNKKRNTSGNNSLKNKNIINSKKIKNAKSKSKSRSKSKENNIVSNMNKKKSYSQNIFGLIKNNKNKNNKKENVLKNKNENCVLEPCTKGKELMNNIIMNNLGSKKEPSKERLPTDSVAKKNLFTLYNQMKAKK